MPTLLAYALLFTGIGAGFVLIHLLIGRLVRPIRPDPEKLTIYECGEPTIGSAWVQFDLRFYVVALLFVVFDVEMAFFFPWAVVFGKSNQMAKYDLPPAERLQLAKDLQPPENWRSFGEPVPPGQHPKRWRDFENSVTSINGPLRTAEERQAGVAPRMTGEPPPGTNRRSGSSPTPAEEVRDVADSFAKFAFLDILVFFSVLLVGFAYLWRRGDLNWVRSMAGQQVANREPEPPVSAEQVQPPVPV